MNETLLKWMRQFSANGDKPTKTPDAQELEIATKTGCRRGPDAVRRDSSAESKTVPRLERGRPGPVQKTNRSRNAPRDRCQVDWHGRLRGRWVVL